MNYVPSVRLNKIRKGKEMREYKRFFVWDSVPKSTFIKRNLH